MICIRHNLDLGSALKCPKCEGPIPCKQKDGWCDYCKLAPLPGLCHQPGPLDWTPEEAMRAAGL